MLVLNSLTLSLLLIFSKFAGKEYFYRLLPLFLIGIISIAFFVSCPGWRVRLLIENTVGHSLRPNILFLSLEHFSNNLVLLFNKSGWLFLALIIGCLLLKPVAFITPPLPKEKKWFYVGVVVCLVIGSYLSTFAYYIPMGNDSSMPLRIFIPVNTLLQLIFCSAAISLPALIFPFRNFAIITLCL
jgi:hypothetical protein